MVQPIFQLDKPSQYEMIMAVRPERRRINSSGSRFSISGSRCAVGSSRMKTGAFRRRARAIASRCVTRSRISLPFFLSAFLIQNICVIHFFIRPTCRYSEFIMKICSITTLYYFSGWGCHALPFLRQDPGLQMNIGAREYFSYQ